MQDMFDTNKIKPQAQQKEQAQAQKSCFVDHKYLLTLANLRPTLFVEIRWLVYMMRYAI